MILKHRNPFLFAVALILLSVTAQGDASAAAPKPMTLSYTNPVWDGYLADPQVLKTDSGYYAYGTGPEHEGRQFPVLHSKDFVNWKFVGNALETIPDPGIKAYWAPEVAEKDGKFYLYYAGEYKMRVAIADHPAGPFRDCGKILFPDEPFSIDGHPFRDPKSGAWYLFFAKDFLDQRVGTALAVVRLGDDMISTVGPVQTVLRAIADWQIYERDRTMYNQVFDAWHTVEGAFVVPRDGRYYCFYSGGNWQTPGYGVGFAVSDTVMGPYQDTANLEGPTVLKTIPGKLIGPGHNSLILGPDGQTWFNVYHSWNPERTKRQMCLDPIEWTADGPRTVNPARGEKTVTLPLKASGESFSLFNGENLDGWHVDVPEFDKNPDARNPFIVRDGNLVSLGTPNGHVITDAVYQNYRLEVEYRFPGKPGNCGVLVHASTPRTLYAMFPKSIEVQMMHRNAGDFWCIGEDITVPDMVKRRGPEDKWGILGGNRRILNLTDDSEKPLGEWNTMVIECVGDEVKVWVNGDLVNHGTKCTTSKGQIALQAEGSEVEFRKLLMTPIAQLSE